MFFISTIQWSSVYRFDHMVPYAVVKVKSHKQIKKAMALQMAQHWGQTEGQSASDTILDNIPSVILDPLSQAATCQVSITCLCNAGWTA